MQSLSKGLRVWVGNCRNWLHKIGIHFSCRQSVRHFHIISEFNLELLTSSNLAKNGNKLKLSIKVKFTLQSYVARFVDLVLRDHHCLSKSLLTIRIWKINAKLIFLLSFFYVVVAGIKRQKKDNNSKRSLLQTISAM